MRRVIAVRTPTAFSSKYSVRFADGACGRLKFRDACDAVGLDALMRADKSPGTWIVVGQMEGSARA